MSGEKWSEIDDGGEWSSAGRTGPDLMGAFLVATIFLATVLLGGGLMWALAQLAR